MNINDYDDFKNDKIKKKKFNKGGSDMTKMLSDQMKGKIDSWAIRFCYHQFKSGTVSVFPSKSKVINNGFSKEATIRN